MKHIIAGVLTALIFFCGTGCKKSENNVGVEQVPPENSRETGIEISENSEAVPDNRSDEEKTKDVVMAWATARYNMIIEILHLGKVDFGIPGGENWLARFRRPGPDGITFESNLLLLVKDEEIVKNFFLGIDNDLNKNAGTQYDIMQNIPGVRLANGTSAYGDFNSDGIHELFQYVFGGMGIFVFIHAYNEETDEIVNYCGTGIPFGIIDPINGPAPVEFMTYNGQYGFKVYYFGLSVAGGPSSKPQHNPDNGKWFFYAFDAAERKYVRVGEVE